MSGLGQVRAGTGTGTESGTGVPEAVAPEAPVSEATPGATPGATPCITLLATPGATLLATPSATPSAAPGGALLAVLGAHLGVELAPRLLTLAGGVRVEVDGIDAAGRVLVQCIPAAGAVKSAQRNKAMADALKLVWLRSTQFVGARVVLCVSEPVSRFFAPPAWLAQAVDDLRIDVYSVSATGNVTQPKHDGTPPRNTPLLE